jgi:hypothetical protein
MESIPDDQMDAVVASAIRHIRAPVRGLPLIWETGYVGAMLSGRVLMGDPLRDPMRMALVPEQVIGDVRPRLQDRQRDEREDRPAAPPGVAAGLAREAAAIVVRKRRVDDITIQDFSDSKLDDALRTPPPASSGGGRRREGGELAMVSQLYASWLFVSFACAVRLQWSLFPPLSAMLACARAACRGHQSESDEMPDLQMLPKSGSLMLEFSTLRCRCCKLMFRRFCVRAGPTDVVAVI